MTAQRDGDHDASFQGFTTQYLGRAWTQADGRPLTVIAETEHRLGTSLPPELIAFHHHLGDCKELLNAHNTIFTLEELEIADGYLFIAEEEQNVVSWAVPLQQPDNTDPVVWQRVNDSACAWYSEEQGVVEFIRSMLDWTFGIAHSSAH
ncbi:hypothetical protein [Streptomyces sp. NPDC091212]|uniref:hypothetical protein n=1 Tax=Streptomyces sp. NPDC091212 TaxID=3155191 RepID=UPI00344AE870